jgi:hypothetical protein
VSHRDLRRGSALPLLLLVLAVAVGGGAWNYHRNWQAEQAMPRPYRGYDDAELAALIDAYEQEASALGARAASARRPEAQPAREGTLLGERVEAFEQARQAGERWRRLQGEAGRHEGVLEDLRAEQTLRAQLGSGLAVHLRRLTSF